jgi:hypothetical protein
MRSSNFYASCKLSTVAVCASLFLSTGCGGSADDDKGTPSSTGNENSTSANSDALDFPQVNYTFSCSSGGTKTVQVSNGPCITSQKAFAKATACNEYDANFTFNSTGRPFYQCLVNNSTGDYKANYQQYLRYYGG